MLYRESSYLIECSFSSAYPGEPGLESAGDRQQEHGGADPSHVRRGPAADLHVDAPRLVPALHQLCDLQAAGPAERRGQRRGRRQRGRHPVQRPAQTEHRVTHSTSHPSANRFSFQLGLVLSTRIFFVRLNAQGMMSSWKMQFYFSQMGNVP